jgi:WD40 repeat protein
LAAATGLTVDDDGAVLPGVVLLWDTATWRLTGTIPAETHMDSVALSPDGALIATQSGSAVSLWDTATRQEQASRYITTGRMTFSPDSKLLAVAGYGQVTLWDIDRDEESTLVGHTEFVNDVAFNVDGSLLATAGEDRTIRLWDVATAQPRGEPLRGHAAKVTGVAFTPDGEDLVSTGADQTIRRWDAVTGLSVGPVLAGRGLGFSAIANNPNGDLLATGDFGNEDSVRIWRPFFADWVAVGCHLVGRNLTAQEWAQVAVGEQYRRSCPDLPPGLGAPLDAPAAEYPG